MLGFLFGDPVPAESAGEVFYRVTGKVCATRAGDFEPGVFGRGRGWSTVAEDPAGSDERADLKLVSSRIDGSVDAAGAVAYLEWTLVIHNSNSWQQEATAEAPRRTAWSRAPRCGLTASLAKRRSPVARRRARLTSGWSIDARIRCS